MKKNIITILGIIALLLITPLPAHAAKLALSPARGALNMGCPTTVNIIINTEGADTMGADAFLFYNPNEIEIIDQMTSVEGVQLRPDNAYESYPGNIVSNGVIRMTAFNRQGYYNGRGVLGSIIFKAKPKTKSSTISFDYSLGRTTDSNVIDVNSNDLLNGASGGKYTFKTGKCEGDVTPPWIEDTKPAPGEMNVPLDSKITFTVRDDLAGVDLKTLNIQVNGIMYSKNGKYRFSSDGKPTQYKITIDPAENFLDGFPVVIKINVQDLDSNVMSEKTYGFNELMSTRECQLNPAACKPCSDTLKCAVLGKPIWMTSLWPWWFELVFSFIL